jgi:hypothetical protein
MRRWTNGLPGATKRLGAKMTQRGLSASQPRMRADTHRGPEHNRSTSEAEYIDAALTFARSKLHLAPHGRAIHPGTFLTFATARVTAVLKPKADVERKLASLVLLAQNGQAPRVRNSQPLHGLLLMVA